MVIGSAIGKLHRVRDYYSRDRSTPRIDEFYGGSQSLTAAVSEESVDGVTTVMWRKPINGDIISVLPPKHILYDYNYV